MRNEKKLELTDFFQLFAYFSPQFFFPDTVTVLIIRHVIWFLTFSHQFYFFSSIFEGKNRQPCSGGDVRLFILSESSRYRPVRTRSVTSNILAQQRRRNGTETWRRRSCQCEHLRLRLNKTPTWWNKMQIYYCRLPLHVSGVMRPSSGV